MTKIIRQSVLNQLDAAKQLYLNNGEPSLVQISDPTGRLLYVDFDNENMAPVDFLSPECFGTTLSRADVYAAIDAERDYQDAKWGKDKPQSLAGFMLVLQHEVQEAVDGWMKNQPGRDSPLQEIVQVAAVAVAALERYGTYGCTISTNDLT